MNLSAKSMTTERTKRGGQRFITTRTNGTVTVEGSTNLVDIKREGVFPRWYSYEYTKVRGGWRRALPAYSHRTKAEALASARRSVQ